MSRATGSPPTGRSSAGRGDELEERQLLADRLRMLRVRRQLNLGTVALGTGLSRSFLALLEAGKSDVSITRLARIAEFYGVWLTDLVGAVGPGVELVRAAEARTLTADGGATLRLMSAGSVRTMQPFRLELAVGGHVDGGIAHSGEEFVHCVAGVVDLEIISMTHRLSTGDTASFPGRLPHSYRNAGDSEAVLVGATARSG